MNNDTFSLLMKKNAHFRHLQIFVAKMFIFTKISLYCRPKNIFFLCQAYEDKVQEKLVPCAAPVQYY